jgi:actin-related protein 6
MSVSLLIVYKFMAYTHPYSCRLGGNVNGITLEYILPDFSRNRHGYIRGMPIPAVTPTVDLGRGDAAHKTQDTNPQSGRQPDGVTETVRHDGAETPYEAPPPSDSDQILYMSNERFTVPELIFNPSDIGQYNLFLKMGNY